MLTINTKAIVGRLGGMRRLGGLGGLGQVRLVRQGENFEF